MKYFFQKSFGQTSPRRAFQAKNILLFLLFFLLLWTQTLSVQALESRVYTGDITYQQKQNILVLDGNNSGGDIKLQFGETLGQYLVWDSVNNYFSFSSDVSFGGNEILDFRVENSSAAPTCDAATAGKMYFNTTDTATYVCSGSTWNQLENTVTATASLPIVQARRTTAYTLTTGFTDVHLDTTDIENNTVTLDHDDTLRDRITIGSTGTYQIIYRYTAGGTATATHQAGGRVRVNDVTVLPGSEVIDRNYQQEFSSISNSFIANLTAGDFISLQLMRDAIVDVTQNDVYLSVIKLEGIQGAKGDTGIAGADGDITWQGAWTAQNYVTNQAVSYLGSSYVCILDTVSNEIPTNTTYWEVLASKGDPGSINVAQAYQATATTFNAATAMPWDGTSISARVIGTGFSHSAVTNPSRISVDTGGLYEITYSIAWITSANARRSAQCQLSINGVVVSPGIATTYGYAQNNTDTYQSNSASVLYSLSAGDYYEIYCSSVGTNGSITTIANESLTSIKKIQ